METLESTPLNQTVRSPHLAWWPVLIIALILSVCRAVRLPNVWSITHYLFSYEGAFQKRSLLGSILRIFSYHYNYWTLAAVAFGFLISALILWVFLLRKTANPLLALVFFTSPGLIYLINIVGYLDYAGILAMLLSLAIQPHVKPKLFFFVCLILSTIAILMHEINLVLCGPGLIFAMSLKIKNTRKMLIAAGLFAGCLLTLAYIINTFGYVDRPHLDQMVTIIKDRVDFSFRQDAPGVLANSIFHDIDHVLDLWKNPGVVNTNMLAAILFMPLTGLFFILSIMAVHATSTGWIMRVYFAILLFICCFAPLLLCIAAWDFPRWYALTQITSFFALMISTNNLQASPVTSKASSSLLAVMILLSLNSNQWFMDGSVMHLFPEYGNILSIWNGFTNEIGIPKY